MTFLSGTQFQCFVSSLQRRPQTVCQDYCVSGGSGQFSVKQSLSVFCDLSAAAIVSVAAVDNYQSNNQM
jgi:hypothetical protein